MKKLLIIAYILFMVMPTMADEGKMRIAVFDPTSTGTSIDDGTKIAIREIISSTIVNTGKHNIVERSLLEKVMQEQQFTNSGFVDDNQIMEIGKLAGANKVVVSVVTLTGGRNMLSIKMIDVKTAGVEHQKVKVVTSGELLDVVEPMTLELIGTESAVYSNSTVPVPEQKAKATPDITPTEGEIVLYLPAGYELKKNHFFTKFLAEADNLITVIFDGEIVGSGSLSEGFNFRIKNPNPGIYKLKFGTSKLGKVTRFKIDTKANNFFEFKIHQESIYGMYSVILKNALKSASR